MKYLFTILTLIVFSSQVKGQNLRILINHLGYETTGPKQAVVEGREQDMVSEFLVVNTKDNKEVFKGKAIKVGPVNKWKNWHFWTINFNDLKTEGTYVIKCKTN